MGNTRLSYSDANADGAINDASRYLIEDSFETQGDWTGFSSYPTGKRRTGSYSARIDNETDNEKIAEMNHWVDINITQPTQYTFSAWVYTNGPQAELFLYMQDENTTTGPSATSQIQQPPTTLDAWVYVTKTVTVQPNIKKLLLRLDNDGQLTSNTTGYTVWFDDVELRKTNIQSEIIAEDDYYAFGMKHKTIGNVVNGGNDLAQKYMYQGQERQDELGLNWDSFKWRNYDYAIARFMCVDPLAEDYVHNGVYNFSENRVIDAVELEGLEAVLIVDKGYYPKGDVGHTFVVVGSGENMAAYTYGRWAGTDENSSGKHTPLNNGPGVMVRLQGAEAMAEAQKYIKNGAEAFEITNASESLTTTILETEFGLSDETPTQGKYKDDDRAHVIDDYDLMSNNCTTKSLDAIHKGLGKPITADTKTVVGLSVIDQKESTENTYSPSELHRKLELATEDENSGVINVTDRFKEKD